MRQKSASQFELEPLPLAIESVVAEEDVWTVKHLTFDTAYEIGRRVLPDSTPVYYTRSVPGSEVSHLNRLNGVKRSIISRDEALGLRQKHDAQWPYRPELSDRLTRLWRLGKLAQYTGAIGNIFHVDEDPDSDAPVYTLMVSDEGTASIEIDSINHKEEGNYFDWQKFILPKGTSACIRQLRYVGSGLEEEREKINGDHIINLFDVNLEYVIKLAKKAA